MIRHIGHSLGSKIGPDFRSPNRSGRYAAGWISLLTALLLLGAAFSGANAQTPPPPEFAGIVIRPGDGTVTYAYIPLDQPTSGIELLRRSGVSLVTVGFGGLGEGVCRIERTGCDVGACRTRLCQTGDRNSPYWRYFQQDHGGRWIAAPLGGSGTKVAPGEIDGWSWTPDEAKLPEVDIAAIPALARAETDPGNAHFARYDENGKLLENGASLSLESKRAYALVLPVLAGIAIFALILRLRSRDPI